MSVQKKQWYKYPYVWLIICLPLSAVIAGIITIRLAVVSDDGLVTDDYYKEGMEINRVLERDNAAIELGLSAVLNLDEQAGKVKLLLSAKDDFNYPDIIKVSFYNRTRKGFDHVINLSKVNESLYSAQLPELIKGNWDVQIEADNWRLLQSLNTL